MVEERILIVDDNVEMLDKTSALLSHVGYSVVTCTSGEEALERLEHERVDLVLLDINMPSLNGFEVCLRIRQMYALDDLPIIFLTSREDSDSVTKGFHSGASDFISKSAIADILLARVNVHIRLSRTLRFLRDISLTDDLTKCYNRRHAMYTLREWFSRSKRYGTSFSLVYFDLNGLKLVNDKYGHQAGDLLLRSVVGVVKKLLRDSDVLFRMGGDEFMVLCPDTDRQGALTCAERMQNAVSGITIVDQSVTFAYGIAHSSEDYKDMDDMLHSADASMYECKKQMHAGRK
ncbi:MAG: diguanylate cyclase [Fibrobacter sp.]|jgi:diguanylate cyclase (GGDEF)-like protein|uniref:GGDEF domain-containing protein n=1 Tax=uncultured Fibrobacter sp. TaxID=261512 RepID=UPI001B2F82D3|nr:diguanylate cyclase [uncultured Fibrobacter sp.]MBO7550421.1 diguanylate cyclase [Fibrobacter sp.]